MDTSHPPEAWKRLGKIAEQRRGQLGYGYRQRPAFLRDRGGGQPPSVKMLLRLERGERTAWPPATVGRLEALYGWEPGSFEAVLDGGDPVPSPGTPGGPDRPVSRASQEDEALRAIDEDERLPRDLRDALIALARAMRDRRQDAGRTRPA